MQIQKSLNSLLIKGNGGFSTVWKVRFKEQFYALKEMEKKRVIHKQSVSTVRNERKLLAQLKHEYLNN